MFQFKKHILLYLCGLTAGLLLLACSPAQKPNKPLLIVTTDIGQDPDDQQSMVRLLHYANEFEILGLIANADANYKHEAAVVKDSILHHLIDTYRQIESNLKTIDSGYPSADQLHALVKTGCAGNGDKIPVETYIGTEKDTEGSNWIIDRVDQTKDRLVNISIWGGACDLAQALWKVKATRSPKQVDAFIQKLRVFFIGKQDTSNDWIIENFPELWLILALDHGGDKWESSYRGMFAGGDMSNTSKDWLHQHIISQNPLAGLYPDKAWTGGDQYNPHMAMKEGDTPSWFYFLPNGLNQPDHPEWGGWGGRYQRMRSHFFRDDNDSLFDVFENKIISTPKGTVFRWRSDFQKDFAARAAWGKPGADGNHYPVIQIKGHAPGPWIDIPVQAGGSLILNAAESFDPDGNALAFDWSIYPEAGTWVHAGQDSMIQQKSESEVLIHIPENAGEKTIHVILRVTDNHLTPLISYQRLILQVE